MSIGRMLEVEGYGWCPLININKKQNVIYMDIFVYLRRSQKNIKCNCRRCI